MRAGSIVFIFLTAALAGCLDGSETPNVDKDVDLPTDGAEGVWAPIQDLMADVPCVVDEVGAATSENLLPLANATYRTGGGFHELDHSGDLVAASAGGGAVFTIINVSDPLRPAIVGNYTDEPGSALDVKFSPDQQTLVVGHRGGISLFDVRDPYEPVRVGRWEPSTEMLPFVFWNPHMVFVERIADQDWVFVAANDNTGIWILKMEGAPDAKTLTYVTRTLPVQGGPLGPHDMYVQLDPTLERWLLYSADGFHGWSVFDVSDPSLPVPLGGFVNPAEGGYTHSVQAATFGLQRLVATTSEIGANLLRVYDATVPAAPVLLGVWIAPQTPGTPPYGITDPQHNINIVDDKLYVAHYARGVYVFDVGQLLPAPAVGTLQLQPIAHYAPDGDESGAGFRGVWDAVVKDGIVYAAHMGEGLHVVGFGCNEPGTADQTSTG